MRACSCLLLALDCIAFSCLLLRAGWLARIGLVWLQQVCACLLSADVFLDVSLEFHALLCLLPLAEACLLPACCLLGVLSEADSTGFFRKQTLLARFLICFGAFLGVSCSCLLARAGLSWLECA